MTLIETVGIMVISSVASAGVTAWITVLKLTVHIDYLRTDIGLAQKAALRAHERIDDILAVRVAGKEG